MKTTLIALAVLAIWIAAFGFAGDVYAQDTTPLYPGNGGNNGSGGNGRHGSDGTGTGIPVEQNINLDGALDDIMSSLIAEGLGISVDELKAREAAGETLVEIGLSLGFDVETIMDMRDQARIDALNQAVADGLITQAQADWLLSRAENGQAGAGAGSCLEDCTQTYSQTAQKSQHGHGGNRPSNNP